MHTAICKFSTLLCTYQVVILCITEDLVVVEKFLGPKIKYVV